MSGPVSSLCTPCRARSEAAPSTMDQTNETEHQAGHSSRGPADAPAVDSSTFSEPHLVVYMESEEKLESEQEPSEPAVDQPNRIGPQAAGQSSRGPADARAVHPATFSEPCLVVEIESNEEVVEPVVARWGARRRRTQTRSLRMNGTPNEQTHNF